MGEIYSFCFLKVKFLESYLNANSCVNCYGFVKACRIFVAVFWTYIYDGLSCVHLYIRIVNMAIELSLLL